MAISNDIEVVVARFDGTYEEFDLPSHSNVRHYSRKLIHVPSGGKYKILLGANKDCARDSGYAFEIYHGMRLKATATLDFRKVQTSREELVHVPEDRQEPYLFPSHDPRRSGDDQSVIRVEVKHFKVNGVGAKKFLSRGHYVFTGNQLPGRFTDHRLLAKFEFVLGNVNYLPPVQAIDPVRNQIAIEASPARITQVQRQTPDATTTTGNDECTTQGHSEGSSDESSHKSIDNEHESVKQSQQSTAPDITPQLPTTKVAAIYETITGGDAPDEYTGLGKGFEDKGPEPTQAPDGSDSTANSGPDNGGSSHTSEEQLAPRHENDIGRKIKELFAHDTVDDARYDFICSKCGLRLGWDSRESHYRSKHQTEPLRPVDEDRRWHMFKGVDNAQWDYQRYLDNLKVLPLRNNVQFKCNVCTKWLFTGSRQKHYHTQHKQQTPKPVNEDLRVSPTWEPVDATKLDFKNGNYSVELPKNYNQYLLAPTNPAPAAQNPINSVANAGATLAGRSVRAYEGMPPPLRLAAPPLNSPASVARRANAVAGSRAGNTTGRTVSAAASMPITREDRNGSTPTAPVRRDTTNGVQRFHPYAESSSSAQSARPATNAGVSFTGSRGREAADRGSERSELRGSTRRN